MTKPTLSEIVPIDYELEGYTAVESFEPFENLIVLAAVDKNGQKWVKEITATEFQNITSNYVMPALVNNSVSRRQAKLALQAQGLLSQVQPIIDAIEDVNQRAVVQIYWDESTEFERTNPVLMSLADALGLSPTDLDNLFELAATL